MMREPCSCDGAAGTREARVSRRPRALGPQGVQRRRELPPPSMNPGQPPLVATLLRRALFAALGAALLNSRHPALCNPIRWHLCTGRRLQCESVQYYPAPVFEGQAAVERLHERLWDLLIAGRDRSRLAIAHHDAPNRHWNARKQTRLHAAVGHETAAKLTPTTVRSLLRVRHAAAQVLSITGWVRIQSSAGPKQY